MQMRFFCLLAVPVTSGHSKCISHIMLNVGVSGSLFQVCKSDTPERGACVLHGTPPSACVYNVMVVTAAALNSGTCEVNQFRQVNPLGNEK